MDPCRDKEPQVIDHNIIKTSLEDQGLKGEAGRLAREEGIPWDEVQEIRLEYMHILRIDHLWVLPALSKLSISNNLIEKIENLETLVNLKELDLSFNKIDKIENMNELVNLEMLCLYDNNITIMENMSSLKKLTIFTIGNNEIEDLDNVLYLRQFKNLKSVNMKGNPCAECENFRMFMATFLPQIIYYEYKIIDEMERIEGTELYDKKIQSIEENEGKERETQMKLEAEIAEAEMQSESFVEFLNTDHLFEEMFENDPEGKSFLKMGDEAMEFYTEYEEQFLAATMQVFIAGQEQYNIRKKEVESFMKIVQGAKAASQQESVAHMETFTEQKESIYRMIHFMQEDVENRELTMEAYANLVTNTHAVTFVDLVHSIWKKLMGLEITLFEQVAEANETFEQTLTELVTVFIEGAQGLFSQVRTLESVYVENMNEHAGRYMTLATITEDFQMPKELVLYMHDKDALANSLAASHDIHMQVIDNREDRLVHRAKAWLNNLVDNLQKDEITRDRAKILEINHYLDIQREEFAEVTSLDIIKNEEELL